MLIKSFLPLLLCMNSLLASDPPLDLQNRLIEGYKAVHEGQPEKAIAMYAPIHRELGMVNIAQLRMHYYNLVCAYALVGKVDEALVVLQDVFDLTAVPVAHLERDGDLDNLRGDPRFKSMVAAYKARVEAEQNLFQGDQNATSFTETLSLEDRMLGLARFWSTAKYSFAFFDQVPELDWDAAYKETLPAIMQAERTEDYYRILMKLMARLEDGHSNVSPPKALWERMFTQPPLRTRMIEGRVVVIDIQDRDLWTQGMAIGDQLTSINGRDVTSYAKTEVNPYICTSTPQDRQNRLYGRHLLEGAKGSTLKLGLINSQGKSYTIETARSGYNPPQNPAIEWELRPDGIGYIAINTFSNQQPNQKLPLALTDLKQAKGIVIDIRENGGGMSGWWVMDYFVPQYRTGRWTTRNYSAAYQAWGRSQAMMGGAVREVTSSVANRFTAPIALLTSARTFSAAEDLAASFKDSRRGRIFGQATGGSTGQPLFVQLPGGGWARFCSKRDSLADGTAFVGVGIQPDEALTESLSDLIQTQDSVLEKAARWCLEQGDGGD